MKTRGTDFVMYQVSDLSKAAEFYRETLGLAQKIYSEEWQWAEFSCGNVTLALHGGAKPAERTVGGRIALAVENVGVACAELKRKGARIVSEPSDFSVCCAVEVLDPDGNTVLLHKRADGTWGETDLRPDQAKAAIIAMERIALDRWSHGDPSGFLEIYAPDIVYFDNTLDHRLDGRKAVAALYAPLRGKILLDRYEMLNPLVQLCGTAAVLTYNFAGHAQEKSSRWNCTEVYRRTSQTWRIIQTHWSPSKTADCEK